MVQLHDEIRRVCPIALLPVMLLICGGCSVEADLDVEPEAQRGVLDLRHFPFGEGAVLSLRGEWLSRAGQDSAAFAEYAYDDAAWRAVPVERYFSEQGYPAEGLVWYRLHLRLPADAPPLLGYLQHANNAHALFAATSDGRVVPLGASGTPGPTPEATVRSRAPVLFTLPADTALVLSWPVANFGYLHGGPFYAIELGSAGAIERMLLRRLGLVFSSFGLYGLIAFAFGLYGLLYRRGPRPFALGALALVMALRTVAVSGALEHLFPDVVGFDVRIGLEAFTYVALLVLFPILLWSFFPREFTAISLGPLRVDVPSVTRLPALRRETAERPLLPRGLRLVNTGGALLSVVAGALFSLVALLASPLVVSHMLSVARWLSLGLLLLAVVVTFEAFERRRPLSLGMMLGFGLVATGGMHDILLAQGVIAGHLYLGTYAFLGFVLIQSYTVARSFVRELSAASAAAQAASRAKSQFLSAVSHEIRTPLTAVIGYSQILEEDLDGRLGDHERDFLQTIRASGERMLHLVNDLLDLARAEAGQINLSIQAVEAVGLVADVVAPLRGLAEGKGLSVALVPPHTDVWVYADGLRLRQVLTNLLSNAIKFTRRGGVTVSVEPGTRPDPDAEAPQEVVRFVVEDTGRGISPKFMGRIFDRFTQEARLYDEAQRGTGLGLALTRELVTRMGGEVRVESKVGLGSTFTVVLPRAEPQPSAAVPGAVPSEA